MAPPASTARRHQAQAVEAGPTNGVLTLTFGKKAEAKPRKIALKK